MTNGTSTNIRQCYVFSVINKVKIDEETPSVFNFERYRLLRGVTYGDYVDCNIQDSLSRGFESLHSDLLLSRKDLKVEITHV